MFKNLKQNKEQFGILLFIIGLVFLLIITYIGFTKFGLWIDELFSIEIVQFSYDDFISYALTDVHPLLYYFIYRFFISLFALFGFSNVILIGRIVSIIPFYLLAVLSLTKIRKNWGMLTAGIFFLCIMSMPRLMIFAVEIRMYSWALFFTTASIIYAYEIIKNQKLSAWIMLTLLTFFSIYTHYFSAIASSGIYLLLLINIVMKNKSLIKYWFISVLAVIISYIPWLPVLFNQTNSKMGNYWIEPITLERVVGFIYFVLSPANSFTYENEIIAPTILGSLVLLAFVILIYRNKSENFAIASLLVFLFVPFVGILISVTVNPFFNQRYLVVVLGCLWLGFSILLSKEFDTKKLFIPILILILIVAGIGTFDFINIQINDDIATQEEFNTVSSILGENNIIISDSFSAYRHSAFTFAPNNSHYCIDENKAANIINLLNDSEIINKINSGSKVFFVDGIEDSTNELNNSGIELREIPFNNTINVKYYKIYEITNVKRLSD